MAARDFPEETDSEDDNVWSKTKHGIMDKEIHKATRDAQAGEGHVTRIPAYPVMTAEVKILREKNLR